MAYLLNGVLAYIPEEVVALVSRLVQAQDAEGWRDIATAPKDGTPIRLKWAESTREHIGRWTEGNNLRWAVAGWRDVRGDESLGFPTHWRLSPAPPSSPSAAPPPEQEEQP